MIALIILSRTLDTISTLLNVLKWGIDVEANLVMLWLLEKGLIFFIVYQIIMTGLMLILWLKCGRIVRTIIKIFVILSFVFSILNLIYYFLIK